jgi:hypothetical protein
MNTAVMADNTLYLSRGKKTEIIYSAGEKMNLLQNIHSCFFFINACFIQKLYNSEFKMNMRQKNKTEICLIPISTLFEITFAPFFQQV